MAFEESNGGGMVMPVSPMYGNGNNGFGGDWAWIIILFLIFGAGGWGNGNGFGGGGLYPWMNQADITTSGFQNQALQSNLSGLQSAVTSGFGDVQNSLCSGFAGVNAGIANAAAQAEISANARQMANMQQLFGIQSAQQQCCCDTRAGIADLRYTVATEACADRAAVGDALQAVTMQGVQNTNALMTTLRDGIQSIKDELCADRLDAERRDNANLRAELMYARGQASQIEQTAQIRASQATTANQLVGELRSCPIPSYSVYGNQPVFTCAGPTTGNNCGCGCNGNGFGFNG